MTLPVPGVDIPQIDLYDAFDFVAPLVDPRSFTCTDQFKGIPVAQIHLDGEFDSDVAAQFKSPSSRLVVTFREEQIFSGWITNDAWQGPEAHPILSASFVGDYKTLSEVTGWPNPANPVTSQGVSYWTQTGPTETIIRNILQANAVTRLGLPIALWTSQGRGPTRTIKSRMDNLSDLIQPLLDEANHGIKFRQIQGGLQAEYVVPTLYPGDLSEDGGQIDPTWTIQNDPATATRVILGGQGQLTAREFQQVIGTELETLAKWKRERFQDARDLSLTADLLERGGQALIETGPHLSGKVPLSESEMFYCYGTNGVHPGDLVNISLLGNNWTDTISSITTTWNASDGLTVTPELGGLDKSPLSMNARRLADLQRRIRKLESRW